MMTKSIKEKFITDDCKELYTVCTDIDEILKFIEEYDSSEIDLSKVKIR